MNVQFDGDTIILNGERYKIIRSLFSPREKKKVLFLCDRKNRNFVLVLSLRDYSFYWYIYKELSDCLLFPISIFPRITFDEETYFFGILYPKGESLNSKTLERLDFEKRKRIVSSLIGKVQLLHAHGICHGDIKPHNVVMIREDIFLIDCEHFFLFPYVRAYGGTKGYKLLGEKIHFYDYIEELFGLLCVVYYVLTGSRFLGKREIGYIERYWQKWIGGNKECKLDVNDIISLRVELSRSIFDEVKNKIEIFPSTVKILFERIIFERMEELSEKDYEEILSLFLNYRKIKL